MNKFLLFSFFLLFSSNVLAGSGWTMVHHSNTFRVVKYNGSKVAEVFHDGKWKFSCLKGRKRGKSGESYGTLKKAAMFVMGECKK